MERYSILFGFCVPPHTEYVAVPEKKTYSCSTFTVYRCMCCSNRDRLGINTELQIIVGTVCSYNPNQPIGWVFLFNTFRNNDKNKCWLLPDKKNRSWALATPMATTRPKAQQLLLVALSPFIHCGNSILTPRAKHLPLFCISQNPYNTLSPCRIVVVAKITNWRVPSYEKNSRIPGAY